VHASLRQREHVGTRGIRRVCARVRARVRNDDKRVVAPVDPNDTIHKFIDFLLLSEVETSAEPPWLSASRHFFLPFSVPSSVRYGFGFESESSRTMMTKAPTIPPAMVSVFYVYSGEMAVKERLLHKFKRAALCAQPSRILGAY